MKEIELGKKPLEITSKLNLEFDLDNIKTPSDVTSKSITWSIMKKEKKPKDKKCPDKPECVIKTWMDEKEKVSQCEICSKITKIE